MTKTRVFRISMPSQDVPEFLAECEAAEWHAFDTGERVMTDEGPDAESVLLVEAMARASVAERAAIAL